MTSAQPPRDNPGILDPVRERGTQARAARSRNAPPTPPSRPDRLWPTIAVIAIVVATVGWTTVAFLALGGGRGDGTAVASPTVDDVIDEESLPPEELSHEAPELEALLPTEWSGTALTTQSWTGGSVLADDDWSLALNDFLEENGKTVADLSVAQTLDEVGDLDLVVGAFQVDGIDAAALETAMIEAWTATDSTFSTSQLELGGQTVTKGTYEDDELASYFIQGDGVVFDIETADENLAAAVIATLPAT
jgi:hypothetical protein